MLLPFGGLRNLRRARQILEVFAVKYGMGYELIHQLGMDRFIPLPGFRRRIRREHLALSMPERVRLALGDLGPTFIKLGQVLSARGDFLPPPFVSELRRLQDEAPPFPFAEAVQVVESELKRPLSSIFAVFNPEPLASASIGQVHEAVLLTGEAVIVKVQRPWLSRLIESDLGTLSDVANVVHQRIPALGRYDLPAFVREFSTIIHDELVYTIEGHNAQTMARNLSGHPQIAIPRPYWELTTSKVLTMERLEGVRIDQFQGDAAQRKALAEALGRAILQQIYVDGFFHGDPHQGNLRVLPDGRLALLDFGMVGRLDRPLRRTLGDLVLAIFDQNADRIVDLLFEIGLVGDQTELSGLRADLERLITRYVFLPRRDLSFGQLFNRMLNLMFHHRIRIPPDLSLLGKVMVVTEGVGTELDPSFDMNEVGRPVVDRLRAERTSPGYLAQEMGRTARRLSHDLLSLPHQTSQVLRMAETGRLRLRLEDQHLAEKMAMGRAWGHRLVLSLLTGSVMVTSGLLVSGPGSSPAAVWLGAAGLVLSGLTAVLVVVGMFRSRT